MIWLSWQTLRFRWPVFIGTFIALTLGVCLMAITLLCIAGIGAPVGGEDDWLRSVAITLLGNAAGVSGAAAIFVVAGTFAFAVSQRRREFALLRAVGATPKQVRRLVMSESLFVGIFAALAGCGLGVLIAPFFARWMAGAELAPANFSPAIAWWPLAIAVIVGLVSAWLSAWAAARRASRVRPIEALSETSLDKQAMTLTRWLAGFVLLLGAALLVPLVLDADTGIGAAFILLEIILLLFGIMMFVPVFAPALIRLAGTPFRTVIGQLAQASLITSLRRTSSTVAPIFITIGLGVAAFSSVATLTKVQYEAAQKRVTVPLVITNNEGLDPQDIRSLSAAADNATIEPVARGSLLLVRGSDRNSDELPVFFVQPSIQDVMRLPLVSGDLAIFRDTPAMAVSEKMAETHNWQLGNDIQLWLHDSPVTIRIAAIVENSDDLGNTALVSDIVRQNTGDELLFDTVYAAPAAGATVTQLRGQLEQALPRGAHLLNTSDFLAKQNKRDVRVDQVALLTVAGLALFYTAISIANTYIMAITGRYRDFALLQLSGATRKQILKMVVVETALVMFVAVLGATLVTIVALAITYASAIDPQLVIPWSQAIAIILACAGIALATSILSTLWSFRIPAIHFTAAKE